MRTAARYRPVVKIGDIEVPYSIYLKSSSSAESKTCTVLALGSTQVGRLPKIIAESIETLDVVIQGLPHWHATQDGKNLVQFTKEFTRHSISCAFSKLNTDKIVLIAESQAVPGAVHYALKNHARIERLILLQPLGLNAKAYTENDASPVEIMKSRIKANTKLQAKWFKNDLKLLYNHAVLLGMNFTRAYRIKFDGHYNIGLNTDIAKELAQVADLMPVHVICGKDDMLFTAEEILETIKKNSINIVSFDLLKGIPHMPLASRAGKKLLDTALTYI